jgi:hypothetical protein
VGQAVDRVTAVVRQAQQIKDLLEVTEEPKVVVAVVVLPLRVETCLVLMAVLAEVD